MSNIPNIPKRSLAEILAEKKILQAKAQLAALESDNNVTQIVVGTQTPAIPKDKETVEILPEKAESFALNISLNDKQLLAKDLAFAGKSFCLIGAAGTGKTTAQREIARSLLDSNKLGTHNFKLQGQNGQRWNGPSVAFVAYTRIASGNLRRAIHKDPELESIFEHNITTIHNLLEFAPVDYWDEVKQKMSMRFIPHRTASNPLDITHLIIEEASMVGLDLWFQLYDAIQPGTQIIMLGDINQLPPVFGPSILNYALTQLPVIELTHVYRQKDDSLVLENAHRILAGKFPLAEGKGFKIMRNGDVQHSQSKLSQMIGQTFPKFAEREKEIPGSGYSPEEDIILSPFNKQELGTDDLNKWIAQFLGTERNAVVHQIIAGINKLYLAVGDKILYNKRVGKITAIASNTDYSGKQPLPASPTLSRFGYYTGSSNPVEETDDFALDYGNLDLDKMLENDTDTVRQCSHHVQLLMEDGDIVDISSVGDFAPAVFSLGYALTVHKAQGCEWRKVFIVLHKDHSIMAFRELLYTAVTRAREDVILITKDFMIEKAIKNPRIKGNTLEEKIEYFNAGLLDKNQGQTVYCTKEF